MPSTARDGTCAAGVCTGHPTPVGWSGIAATGDGLCKVDNQPIVRLGDMYALSCGHVGVVVSASGDNWSSNLGVAKVGDLIIPTPGGTGVIVSGSGLCNTDG